MRLQDKRSFKAINFDDADEYLEDGDTRGMLNVRVGYSESGDDGVITNVKGTISLFSELSFSLPSGTNKCIGTCTDDQNNRLIWFNFNSNSSHGIYCYNVDSNTIQTILASATLNFSDSIIHSIDILNGELAWVDENRPRTINVPSAIAGVYAGAAIEELINDAKLVPMFPPVCTPEATTGEDYIQSLKSFQFIYRYVFIGGEKGAWSSVSRLVSTGFKGEHINKITLDVSACELFTKTAMRPVISYIEFASRELYTFNFNQFLRITAADLVAAGGIVDYFDTESKTPLDAITDTNIPFYENPIKAGTVAYKNDRKFYADCTEGYDATSLSPVNISTEVVPELGGIPYLSDCSTHGSERYLKPDSVYSYSAAWYDEYGRKSGAISLPELVIRTQAQTNNDYKANVLNFDLNLATAGTYPAWAEKFEILRSDNQSVTWFAQGRVNNVLYCTGYDANGDPTYINATPGPGDLNVSDAAVEIHVDISNWSRYKINIGYSFSEGDRITFFTMGGTGATDVAATADLRRLKVKELRGSLLIVDYLPIGRTRLNDINMANTSTEYTNGIGTFAMDQIIRVMVGDNGAALYSAQYPPDPHFGDPVWMETNYSTVKKIPNYDTTNNLNSLSLVYPSTTTPTVSVYIVGDNGYFVKGTFIHIVSTVNDISWSTFTQIPTGITENINCIESDFANHNMTDLIMVCDSGKILKYNIAGNSISNQASGVSTRLNYIYRESSVLIAVGDEGVILRSTNNGTTWTLITVAIPICQNLHSVYLNGVNGCIVGDEGVVLASNDSGVTWVRIPMSTKNNLYSVDGEGSSTSHAYIAGEGGYAGKVLMSAGGSFTESYNSGTSKDIYRLLSFGLPVGQNRGALVGDTDTLINADFVPVPAYFAGYSANVATIYGTLYLNYGAKVELFSPKTTAGPTIYYEVGDAYPVGQNYSFSKGKGNDGDVYLIKKDFQGDANGVWSAPGEFIFSMTPDSYNTTGAWDKDLGRPNVVLLYPEIQQRRNIIRYSDKYVQDSKINGLSNFREANYEVIPNEFGHARKITPLETMILINCERDSATAHIDQTMFTQSNGEQVAGLSERVINNIRKLTGGFGCTNPESISNYLGQVYWYSSNKSAVCRYNSYNGVFPISEYKARTYFYSLINAGRITGGYEPKFKNYLMTMDGFLDGSIVIPPVDLGTAFENTVFGLVVQNDEKVIAVGGFGSFNGVARSGIARLNTNGSLDTTFVVGTGANDVVYDAAIQSDGKIIIAGDFTTYNGSSAVRLARLNTDGSIDTAFNTGTGANAIVRAISIQSDGKIIIAGDFTTYNGSSAVRLARLNTDGSIDTAFNTGTGANVYIYSTAIQGDGKILIGGDFTAYNGSAHARIARINTDGSLDPSLVVGTGPSSTVLGIGIQSDGKIVIGGTFTSYNGTGRNRIARLNTNGSLDSSFAIGTGANNDALIVYIQSDGKIIIGGSFTAYNGTAINHIARLDSNGALDNTFDVGTGANLGVDAIVEKSDGSLVIAGYFTTYNSIAANRIIGLNHDGTINNEETTILGKQTIAFQEGSGEKGNRWISKYSFVPERYGYVKTKMFSFKDGEMWEHDASNVCNNFYGVQYTSRVNPVFNREPNSQKSFIALSQEGDKVWAASAMTTHEGQESFILSGHYEKINNEWWADVKQDINTPNMISRDEALINGDFMQSNTLNVLLESTLSDATKLRFVNLYSNINERTNK